MNCTLLVLYYLILNLYLVNCDRLTWDNNSNWATIDSIKADFFFTVQKSKVYTRKTKKKLKQKLIAGKRVETKWY